MKNIACRFMAFLGWFVLSTLVSAGSVYADSYEECGIEAKPCLAYGASIFQQRCALCHGSDGYGEGLLPLSIKNYPDTNLVQAKLSTSHEELLKMIEFGGVLPGVSDEMPPWGDALTSTQIDSLVLYIEYLRDFPQKANALSRRVSAVFKPSWRDGRVIYRSRCALCHGAYGQGDGKMARIITSPPPFDLTESRRSDRYLKEIISKGGDAMQRSPRMPPFGEDLSEREIESVILHIKKLRHPGFQAGL